MISEKIALVLHHLEIVGVIRSPSVGFQIGVASVKNSIHRGFGHVRRHKLGLDQRLDGGVANADRLLSADLEVGVDTFELGDKLAGGQVELAHFGAGQMVHVGIVHFVDAAIKEVDQIADQLTVDVGRVADAVIGTEEDLVDGVVVAALVNHGIFARRALVLAQHVPVQIQGAAHALQGADHGLDHGHLLDAEHDVILAQAPGKTSQNGILILYVRMPIRKSGGTLRDGAFLEKRGGPK